MFASRPLTAPKITGAFIVEPNKDGDGTALRWDELPGIIDDEYINIEIIDVCSGLVKVRPKNSKMMLDPESSI